MRGKGFTYCWMAFVLPTVVGGCSVYDYRYSFAPRPAEVHTQDSSGQSLVGMTLVSIVGVRRPDPQTNDGAIVEVRLRVMNRSDLPIAFDPTSLVLVSADLVSFQKPRTSVQDTLIIEPHQSATVTALFPFPEGRSSQEVDLSSLNLSWDLQVNKQAILSSVTVTREYQDDYDSFYHGRHYPFIFHHHGFGYHHPCW